MLAITSQDIGSLVRQQRKALDWSQAKLAEQTMVSRDWIVQLEKGKATAELGLVLRALKALGLLVDIAPRKMTPKDIALDAMLADLVS